MSESRPGWGLSGLKPGVSGIVRGVAAASPRWRFARAMTEKFGMLLVALLALIALAPVLAENENRAWLVSLLSALVLLASLHAARPGLAVLGVGIGLVLADFLIGRLAFALGEPWLLVVQAMMWLTTLVYVTATILDAIFDRPRVDADTVLAALCVYLLFGLVGAFLLVLIELVLPGSFTLAGGEALLWNDNKRVGSFMKLMSFSYATLSRVGGTQVVAATDFGTNLTSVGGMVDQIYLAVVVARFVGLESSGAGQGGRSRAANEEEVRVPESIE